MLKEQLCLICVTIPIFAWRASIRLYVYSMNWKLFYTNLITNVLTVTLKLRIRFWDMQNQPRFHSCLGFIAKLCDVYDLMLEVVYSCNLKVHTLNVFINCIKQNQVCLFVTAIYMELCWWFPLSWDCEWTETTITHSEAEFAIMSRKVNSLWQNLRKLQKYTIYYYHTFATLYKVSPHSKA
jgi:hypothetical protein